MEWEISADELKRRMGIACFSMVMRSRLRWFGHMQRMEEDSWVKRVRDVKAEARVVRGRPKKTWNDVVQNNLRVEF